MKRESYVILHKTHNALNLEMSVSGGVHAQLLNLDRTAHFKVLNRGNN